MARHEGLTLNLRTTTHPCAALVLADLGFGEAFDRQRRSILSARPTCAIDKLPQLEKSALLTGSFQA